MSDTIKALTETVRGRVITASDPGGGGHGAPGFGTVDDGLVIAYRP